MYSRDWLLIALFWLLSLNAVNAQQLLFRKILLHKVEVLLPSDFKQMDTNTIILKYPDEGGRPDEVYANNNSSVSIAFTHSVKKVRPSDITKNFVELINILKQRGMTIISQSLEKINDKDFLIIEFNSKALNGNIYNKMFFTSLL